MTMPSTTSIFSAYASCAASLMLIQSIINKFIPRELQTYLLSIFRSFFLGPSPSNFTLVIEAYDGITHNGVYDASETYLSSKISPNVNRLKVSLPPRQKTLSVTIEEGQEIVDEFEGIRLRWKLIVEKQNSMAQTHSSGHTRRRFELSFEKKYKETVLANYLPYVLKKANAKKDESREIKLYRMGMGMGMYRDTGGDGRMNGMNLDHPSTFDKLAMDPKVKMALINDLDRFVKRREMYRKVGKAWKRGYLLYGPPGTGKSSLIAAMANYLKFDVYDLELTSICRDSDLRTMLLATGNRSILVIEDIDCSAKVRTRAFEHQVGNKNPKLTLSGLLNFIDGLWSSVGDQRIIVFTTNHKDRLDPAILRPGRMDMHIHMSYCTPVGFKLLASNYLNMQDHPLFEEIIGLIDNVEVTPAEIAEELLKSDEPDIALEELVQFLLQKKIEKDAVKEVGHKEEYKKIEQDAPEEEEVNEVEVKGYGEQDYGLRFGMDVTNGSYI